MGLHSPFPFPVSLLLPLLLLLHLAYRCCCCCCCMLVVLIIAAVMTNAPAAEAATAAAPQLTSPPMWQAGLYTAATLYTMHVCVWVLKRVRSVCVCECARVCRLRSTIDFHFCAFYTRFVAFICAVIDSSCHTYFFCSALFWALSVAFNWYTCFFARQRESVYVCVLFKIAPSPHPLPRHPAPATHPHSDPLCGCALEKCHRQRIFICRTRVANSFDDDTLVIAALRPVFFFIFNTFLLLIVYWFFLAYF